MTEESISLLTEVLTTTINSSINLSEACKNLVFHSSRNQLAGNDNWWSSEWWQIPLIVLILLLVVVVSSLVICAFLSIRKINYLSEDLQEMDKEFLKTLSEHDREVLEECAQMACDQTNEQVAKLWAIYIEREDKLKKRRREERARAKLVTSKIEQTQDKALNVVATENSKAISPNALALTSNKGGTLSGILGCLNTCRGSAQTKPKQESVEDSTETSIRSKNERFAHLSQNDANVAQLFTSVHPQKPPKTLPNTKT